MTRKVQRLTLAGPEGELEALLDWPEGEVRGAALVCHPHPLHGGSMHTKAVYRTARALVGTGLVTLRFNFRGAGRSAGRFGGGDGEIADARAALGHVERLRQGGPLFLGGFSFGAHVALRLGTDPAFAAPVQALLAIAPPVMTFDLRPGEATSLPVLLVAGDADLLCPVPLLVALQQQLGEHAELVVLPGAGHLLLERLAELEGAVQRFVARVLVAHDAARPPS